VMHVAVNEAVTWFVILGNSFFGGGGVSRVSGGWLQPDERYSSM
jgi:hypothetical protein